MRYTRIHPILLIAAACFAIACLADSIATEYDYLEGGYVRSLDRSGGFEPGIAGMVKWLDLPVPVSTFAPYREYYITPVSTIPVSTRTSLMSVGIGSPVPYNISGRMPSGLYYGDGQAQSFSSYATSLNMNRNDLWISGHSNWTQYAIIPVSASLQLLASVPAGGMGSIYQVIQTDAVKTQYQSAQFNPGYSSMNFYAGQTGRYMLYFVVNNMPSNVVIVDVFSQSPG